MVWCVRIRPDAHYRHSHVQSKACQTFVTVTEYRHFPTYAVTIIRKYLYVYTQGSPVDVRTPTQSNMMDHPVALVIAQQYS